MCRYEYGNGKCAHPNNLSLDCVGEDSCIYISDTDTIDKMESALSLKEKNQEDQCPNTQCGLYCKKYNRFYCAGEENCETEDEYLSHMNTYGGVDIGKGNS